MSVRLSNSNAVSQQKIIYVVRGEKPLSKTIVIKSDQHENEHEIDHDPSDDNLDNSEVHQEHLYYENLNESELVWANRKPTDIDHHATEYFLQLRGSEKYRTLFSDKKHGKLLLWSQIAEEMNNAGYYVGEGKEAAERCRQKFSNLEKGFLGFIKHLKTPGSRKREPPQFYDLLYNLVDHEEKLSRQEQNNSLIDAVRDNLQIELNTLKDDSVLPTTENQSPDVNPQIKPKKSKQKDEIIALLTKQHKELVKLQTDYLEKIDKHLTIQNEQRERMINCFMDAMKDSCECKSKKRRLESDDSDVGKPGFSANKKS